MSSTLWSTLGALVVGKDLVNQKAVESPCTKACKLNADKVCVGCYRTREEIGAWGQVGDASRRRIVRDAQSRREAAELAVAV